MCMMGVTCKKKMEWGFNGVVTRLAEWAIAVKLTLKICDLRGLNFNFICVKIFRKTLHGNELVSNSF